MSLHQCLSNQNIHHVRSINWNCIDENGRFYQYLRHSRKRTYKEIEEDRTDLLKEVNALAQAKIDLEGYLKDVSDELEWYKTKEQHEEDLKDKLDLLKEKGIVDDNYEPK